MITFNCYACHARDKIGGPLEELNPLFLTSQPEMGDESRVPPPLDGVGSKLNFDYFKQIVDKGVHDRPYMHTRMPGFGLANVGPVVEAFAAVQKENRRPFPGFKQFKIDVCDFGHRQACASRINAVWFCRAAARSLWSHGGTPPGQKERRE